MGSLRMDFSICVATQKLERVLTALWVVWLKCRQKVIWNEWVGSASIALIWSKGRDLKA
jgi:hypothetical protein